MGSLLRQVPDVISQNSLIYSLQEDQKWHKALAALDTCERSSLQISPVTYGTVLKLCKDSGHIGSKVFFSCLDVGRVQCISAYFRFFLQFCVV